TASPATVAEASALLAAAAAHDLAVVPRGGGSKFGWGAPPRRCDLVVDTTALDQVVEHAAGDLIARVQAGVSVARLGEVLARAGQQLALDPPPAPLAVPGIGAGSRAEAGSGAGGAAGSPAAAGANGAAPGWLGATVGGALATGAAGPRRLRYGTPRDLIIGITVVRADGTVARSGGKVVKNVAGYDLGRLFTGAFGTLGLVVEAGFPLPPLPRPRAYRTAGAPAPPTSRWTAPGRMRRTGRSPRRRAAPSHRRPSRSTARRTGSRCGWPCCWKATRTAPQSAPGRFAPCSVRGRPRSRRRPRGGAGKLAATGGPARRGRPSRRGSPARRGATGPRRKAGTRRKAGPCQGARPSRDRPGR